MTEREVTLNIKNIIILILFLLIFISSMLFRREIDLMGEGMTFKQARIYFKEKDNLRKEIMELKRENDLLELRQELEKLKK